METIHSIRITSPVISSQGCLHRTAAILCGEQQQSRTEAEIVRCYSLY